MFKRIVHEIILFVFSTNLLLYVLFYCFICFLIDIFIGSRIAKILMIFQEKADNIIEKTASRIIRKLEGKNMWY